MSLRAPSNADIERLRADPGRTAIICDFDGSLAPIVEDPERAEPLPGAADVLAALARRYAIVAVVSGRPASFLRRVLLDPPGVHLAGLYGVEHVRDGRVHVHPDAAARADAVGRAADTLADTLGDLYVEHKGYAVAVHARRAADPAAALARAEPVVRDVAEREGLVVHAGRLVLELSATAAVDKGTATHALIGEAGLHAGLAAGDDLGDVAMFSAMAALPYGLRVAVLSDETPTELVDAADVGVTGPSGLLELLHRLEV